MNEEIRKTIAADAAIKKLEGMNDLFVAEVKKAPVGAFELGALSVDTGCISCTCHGKKVVATPRPVVVDGQVAAMEYDFVTEFRKEEVSILRLYLQLNGIITRDAPGVVKFCDFNNIHIRSNILSALSAGLLASRVYAPGQG